MRKIDSVFITVIIQNGYVVSITMDPKKMLSKEIAAKFGGRISEQTVSETVEDFFKQGNVFLLLEIMNLKAEIETLKEELENRENNKAQTLRELLVQ